MNLDERWRRAAADNDAKAQRAILRDLERTSRAQNARPDVGFLCDALDDPDENVRRSSLYALAKFSRDNPALVTAVRDRVERSQYPVNFAVLAELVCSAGKAAEEAVPLLLEILESLASEPSMLGGEFLWEKTLDAIADVGPAARDAIPRIIWSLDAATDDRVPSAAADALSKIGPTSVRPMMDFIEREQSSDFARQEVTRALGNIPAAADESVPFLIQQLVASRSNKHAAVRALGMLGPPASAAVPYLTEPLPYSDSERLWALWNIQRDAALVVPGLIVNLEGNDPRASVAHLLGEIGPEARAAVPALRKLLSGDDRNLWVDAAIALWKIDAWEDTLPVIAAADWLIRAGHSFAPWDDQILQCADAIHSWPSHAAALRVFLGRRRANHLDAARQLQQADPCIIPALVLIVEWTPQRRNTRYRDIVAKAMEVLGAFGDKAAVAASPLVRLHLRRTDRHLERVRIQTLGQIARGSAAVVSTVAAAANHHNAAVRFAAAQALGRIGIRSEQVASCLTRGLRDTHPRVRAEAAKSLGLLPLEASPLVVSELIEALSDRSRRVRASAVKALSEITPAAVEAIPALQQLLKSDGLKGLESVILRSIERISCRDEKSV